MAQERIHPFAEVCQKAADRFSELREETFKLSNREGIPMPEGMERHLLTAATALIHIDGLSPEEEKYLREKNVLNKGLLSAIGAVHSLLFTYSVHPEARFETDDFQQFARVCNAIPERYKHREGVRELYRD